MPEQELQPCAFCSSELIEIMRIGHVSASPIFAVVCHCCGAVGPRAICSKYQVEEAARMASALQWNDRATVPQEDPPANVAPVPQPGQAEGEKEVQPTDSGGELDNNLESSEEAPAPPDQDEESPEEAEQTKTDPGEAPEQRGDDAEPDRHPIDGIAGRLIQYIKDSGHTISQVSADVEISEATLYKIKAGSSVSKATLQKLDEALDRLEVENEPEETVTQPRPITAPIRNTVRIRNPKEAADFLKNELEEFMSSESLDPATAAQSLSITGASMQGILHGDLPHQNIIHKLADKLPEVARARGLLLHQRHELDKQAAA